MHPSCDYKRTERQGNGMPRVFNQGFERRHHVIQQLPRVRDAPGEEQWARYPSQVEEQERSHSQDSDPYRYPSHPEQQQQQEQQQMQMSCENDDSAFFETPHACPLQGYIQQELEEQQQQQQAEFYQESSAPCQQQDQPYQAPSRQAMGHVTADVTCTCPMCELGVYISCLFGNQRRASPHVMAARPSPCLPPGTSLPPLHLLPSPKTYSVCPVYAVYGYCPYSRGCYLPHPPPGTISNASDGSLQRRQQQPPLHKQRAPLVPRGGGAQKELERLISLAASRSVDDLWSCMVCGTNNIDMQCVGSVGETYYYRQCPTCSLMCYAPFVTYLIDEILDVVGDDYQRYKSEVDRFRSLLPDEFKVPLSFEAHRIATNVFAWSLVSPSDARDAMEAAHRVLPDMEAVVSVGSGNGYAEHVFNRVLNNVGAGAWETNRSLFPSTSFDGVTVRFSRAAFSASAGSDARSSARSSGGGGSSECKRIIPIYAFDELALRRTYSVHVSLGSPLSVLSMDCRRTVLLLCWPPFGSAQEEQSSMAFEALEYFKQCGGSTVIYVGDVASTGDWRFHQLLYTAYKLVRDYPVRRELRRWYPQEMGLVYAGNDTIGVYKRREMPIPLPLNWSCGM